MLRTVILIGLVALASAQKATFDNFKVYRLVPENQEQLQSLRQLEKHDGSYEFWRGPSFVRQPVDVMAPPSRVPEITELFATLGLEYETYIENVQELIDQENPVTEFRDSSAYDFKSYKTLEQIYAYLEAVAKNSSGRAEVVVAGRSHEGREIKGVRISHGENRPTVFIESGIHAREWVTCATATYIIDALLNSRDKDVRQLAEAYDFYIVPSVNPDGYVYTHQRDRLWRKTRSPGRLCSGADANRNWDYEWMTTGASSNPCAETYAGKGPFSEIETRSLAKYVESLKGRLFAYISFHSYSQLLLFPYGHTSEHLENYEDLNAIAGKAVAALSRRYGTKYQYGNIAEAIYEASGSSIDWAKAVLKLPLAYTYEFRDQGRYGFILPASQIIPNSEEVLDSLVAMFREAKRIGYPRPRE